MTIGAPLAGRVLVVDDVISAGTSVRESVDLIRGAGAEVRPGWRSRWTGWSGALGPLSAVQEVRQTYQIPVISIATLDDVVAYLTLQGGMARELQMVTRYRNQYGVAANGSS